MDPRDPVDRAIAAVETADQLETPTAVMMQTLELSLAPWSRPAVLIIPIDLSERELRELMGTLALQVPAQLERARAQLAGVAGGSVTGSGIIVPGRA